MELNNENLGMGKESDNELLFNEKTESKYS